MIDTQLNESVVREALRQVIDPEIGCNIVDLGLVYDIGIDADKVTIKMTLTTRGCPMHQSIVGAVQAVLLSLEGVQEVSVELVWDPPWHPELMSNYGRAHVGYSAV